MTKEENTEQTELLMQLVIRVSAIESFLVKKNLVSQEALDAERLIAAEALEKVIRAMQELGETAKAEGEKLSSGFVKHGEEAKE